MAALYDRPGDMISPEEISTLIYRMVTIQIAPWLLIQRKTLNHAWLDF